MNGEARFERLSAAERSRRMLLGSEIGLEVREWIIEANSETIANAISAFRADAGNDMHGVIVDDDVAGRLRINGLRLVPVRVDDLPALEAALGFATLNRRGWYGQLAEWTPLHGHLASSAQLAIFIDGRPRRFDRGEFRLISRAWILPMEDGPQLNLQIVHEYVPPQRESLQHLLGRSTQNHLRRGEPINSIAIDLLIRPEYALILTGEEPNVEWKSAHARSPGLSRDERAGEESVNESDDDRNNPSDSPGQGRGYLGPYAEVPPTLGEMLFKLGGVRDGRGMLIFVPRVPDELDAPLARSRERQQR